MADDWDKDAPARFWLAQWRERLGVRTPVRLERVSIWQVAEGDGRRGCSLVGVVLGEGDACLCHTRCLTEEDIVHELLHVLHREWSEAQVVAETEKVLAQVRGRWRVIARQAGV